MGTVISGGKGLADQRTRQSAADLRVTEWGPFGANMSHGEGGNQPTENGRARPKHNTDEDNQPMEKVLIKCLIILYC